MQKEPMNIFERWAIMLIVIIVMAAVVRACVYG